MIRCLENVLENISYIDDVFVDFNGIPYFF